MKRKCFLLGFKDCYWGKQAARKFILKNLNQTPSMLVNLKEMINPRLSGRSSETRSQSHGVSSSQEQQQETNKKSPLT